MSNISKEQILEGVNGEIKRLTRMLECGPIDTARERLLSAHAVLKAALRPKVVSREQVVKRFKEFIVKDDPVGRWQSQTTVSGIYPYMLRLGDILDLYRELGIVVEEKP